MKTTTTRIFRTIAAVAIASGLWSCTAETPFDTEQFGTVRLHTVVSNITTRTLSSEETTALEENCVVYISDVNATDPQKALILKKTGIANVPPSLRLPAGKYVAEAWAGDSVSASFDKKFFRGYQKFDVSKDAVKSVALNCGIMNVIVSIDSEGINKLTQTDGIMKDDYSITVRSSNASLVFNKTNLTAKGYFMLPQDNLDVKNNSGNANATVSTLNYTITGTRADGNPFTVNGKIENVKPACQYILKLNYNGQGSTGDQGGGTIEVKAEETQVTAEPQVSVSAPAITGVGFNIDSTLAYTGLLEETTVQICAHGGFKSISVSSDCTDLGLPSADTNIIDSTSLPSGMVFSEPQADTSTGVSTAYVIFRKELLKKLPAGNTHTITIAATDTFSLSTTKTLTISR